jgi:tetratricopeptide (TPR) repeat protein
MIPVQRSFRCNTLDRSDRFFDIRVYRLVTRFVPMFAAALLLMMPAACKKNDKGKTTPKGSTGTVTTEDTKLMGDGGDIPDAKGDGSGNESKTDDSGDAGGKEADGTSGAEVPQPELPKIEPPDLDIGAEAQAQSVAKHLDAARLALSGPKKDPDLALREAQAALTADAANVDAVVLMAHANYHKRLYDTAEIMLDMLFKSRKKAKTTPGVYYVYGLIYDRTDKPEKALVAYQKAIELDPEYRSALINLGVHHLRNHAFDDAIAIYEKLTGTYKMQTAPLWTNLGSSHRGHSGDYPAGSDKRVEQLRKAETAYKRALSADRNYGNVYYNLGLLYLDAEPFPMPDGSAMDLIKRLERAKTYFEEYRTMSGADIELVEERLKHVNKLINRETKRRKREETKAKKTKKDGGDDW